MKHLQALILAASMALMSVQAQAEAFQNGDFSAGDLAWTADASFGFYDPLGGIDLAAVFASPGSLSQTFDTVATADTTYSLKFYLSSDGSWGDNVIRVDWNGVAVSLVSASNPITLGTTSWTAYEATGLIGGVSSSTLTFVGDAVPGYVYLDNVSVTEVSAVPEPSTYAMLLAGLGMLGVIARRRTRG